MDPDNIYDLGGPIWDLFLWNQDLQHHIVWNINNKGIHK